MKCPRQLAFSKQLQDLLIIYAEILSDRFSVDETDKWIEKFSNEKRHFINSWCPTLKEYEEIE